MDYLKVQERLITAANHHHANTQHRGVVVGFNFVECPVCKKHAHIDLGNGELLEHDARYIHHEVITPGQF